jgi:DNA-binding transcriptional MerR regulator
MSVAAAPALHPFVVTGCPRSGTHYLSEVLTRVGLVCRHEAVFGPHERAFTGLGRAHGDSSWLAVPFLAQLPPDAVVLHQTRHPLEVVRSLLGIGFLEDVAAWRDGLEGLRASVRWRARTVLAGPLGLPDSDLGPRPYGAFRRFVVQHAPEVFDEPTPAERALRLWVSWNQAATANASGHAGYRRYRIEDLDATLLADLLAAIGLPVTTVQAALALQTASREMNSRRRADIAWQDLPGGPARRDAEDLAAEYSYVTSRTLSP